MIELLLYVLRSPHFFHCVGPSFNVVVRGPCSQSELVPYSTTPSPGGSRPDEPALKPFHKCSRCPTEQLHAGVASTLHCVFVFPASKNSCHNSPLFRIYMQELNPRYLPHFHNQDFCTRLNLVPPASLVGHLSPTPTHQISASQLLGCQGCLT